MQSNFRFQIHLDNACNLNCKHCYLDKDNRKTLDKEKITLWMESALKVIRKWSYKYNINHEIDINLTGGEPFLYENIEYVVDKLTDLKLHIFILSNGTIDITKKLSVIEKVSGVQIGLEGTERVNDCIRGNGSFKKAIKTVELLQNINKLSAVNVTMTKLLLDDFDRLMQYFRKKKISKIGFKRYVPDITSINDPYIVTNYEFSSFISKIKQEADLFLDDPLMNAHTVNGCSVGGCSVGFGGLSILPNGDVLPCSKLNVKLGNIYSDSFEEIWLTSPLLKKLRTKKEYNVKCRNCLHWASCRGCRAFAYASKRDLFSEDSYCSSFAKVNRFAGRLTGRQVTPPRYTP